VAPEDVISFRGEATLMECLEHAHFMAILGEGTQAGDSFLVMEYMANGDPRLYLARSGQLDAGARGVMVRQVCAAMVHTTAR
jgi:hypothetical protein